MTDSLALVQSEREGRMTERQAGRNVQFSRGREERSETESSRHLFHRNTWRASNIPNWLTGNNRKIFYSPNQQEATLSCIANQIYQMRRRDLSKTNEARDFSQSWNEISLGKTYWHGRKPFPAIISYHHTTLHSHSYLHNEGPVMGLLKR